MDRGSLDATSQSRIVPSALADAKRFPSGEGSFYFVGGVGVSYKQRRSIIIAPIRTGVGLRAGINAGWVKFSDKKSIIPF